jgi:putative endonuclease
MENTFYVFILANRKHGTLYTGMTSDLVKRVLEHKNDVLEGFTIRYQIHLLVYYEKFTDKESAVSYEHRLKKARRDWLIELIEKLNPDWNDLYDSLPGRP